MIIVQSDKGFQPIHLTLETREEADAFYAMLECEGITPRNDGLGGLWYGSGAGDDLRRELSDFMSSKAHL